jgi:hypothetical protein
MICSACCALRTPTIAPVIAGFRRTHAIATSPGGFPQSSGGRPARPTRTPSHLRPSPRLRTRVVTERGRSRQESWYPYSFSSGSRGQATIDNAIVNPAITRLMASSLKTQNIYTSVRTAKTVPVRAAWQIGVLHHKRSRRPAWKRSRVYPDRHRHRRRSAPRRMETTTSSRSPANRPSSKWGRDRRAGSLGSLDSGPDTPPERKAHATAERAVAHRPGASCARVRRQTSG